MASVSVLEAPSFDQLYAWLREHGATWKMAARSSEAGGGRTLVAAEAIHPGETFFKVPRKLLLTPKVAYDDPGNFGKMVNSIPDELLQETQDSIKNLALVLFLIYERSKGKLSFWYPHIQVQPNDFTSPLYFTDDELQWLEGTPLLPMAQAVKEELKEIHAKVVQFVNDNHPSLVSEMDWSLDAFFWGVSVVDSRAFRLCFEGEDTTVIVPFIDMANHDPKGTQFDRTFDHTSEFLTITYKSVDPSENDSMSDDQPNGCASEKPPVGSPLQPLAPGKELLFRYSKMTNWQTLMYYGFALEMNPDDAIEFSIPPPDDEDYQVEVKKQLFLAMCEDDFTMEHTIEWDPSIFSDAVGESRAIPPRESWKIRFSEGMMPSLRLMFLNAEEINAFNVENIVPSLEKIVSKRNEIQVYQNLANLFDSMMYTYPTNLEEDEELLKTRGRSMNDKELFSLYYRLGQKRLISCGLQYVEAQLDSLDPEQ